MRDYCFNVFLKFTFSVIRRTNFTVNQNFKHIYEVFDFRTILYTDIRFTLIYEVTSNMKYPWIIDTFRTYGRRKQHNR